MSATNGSNGRSHSPELHEIRVHGHLDKRWAEWVHGLAFTHEIDGTTTLIGPLADQAALHGVLNRMRDLGIPIVSVRRLSVDEPGSPRVDSPQVGELGSTGTNNTRSISQ